MKLNIYIFSFLLICRLYFIGYSYPYSNFQKDSIHFFTTIDSLLSLSDQNRASQPNLSLSFALEALEVSLTEEYDLGIASSYSRLGTLYQYLGKYGLALECFSKSAGIYEKIESSRGLGTSYNSFGWLWFELEDYDKAYEYFRRTKEVFQDLKLDNQEDIINFDLDIALGSIYLNYGSVLDELGKHDSAAYYFYNALEIFKIIEDSVMIANTYIHLGNHYMMIGRIDTAKSVLDKGELLSQSIGMKDIIIEVNISFGDLYQQINQPDKAIDFYTTALNTAREIGYQDFILASSYGLSNAYKSIGEFENSIFYKSISDSITNELGSYEKQLARIEWERERELENQLKEKELQRQKLIKNFYLAATAIFLVMAFFIYRNFRIKQKANKLLAEMDELKSHLFSNISHEFRTPLTLILGPLEQMLAEETGKSPTQKTVKMMQRNANRLLELVNQMLDLSKVEAGNMKLELMEGDVLKSLRILLSSFSSLAEKKEIKYNQIAPEAKLIAWFDLDKMEKIITNLLSNAFKFTPESGIITTEVIVSDDKDKIQIRVQDSGKGISTEQLEKIFDRFHQVEEQGEPDRIGTGIGLALTKELVDLMHGEIKVESKVEEGTVFTVTLPLGKNHLREDEYNIIDSVAGRKMKEHSVNVESDNIPSDNGLLDENLTDSKYPVVLTVEDHSDIRAHIKEHLEDCCRMLEASDGEMGLNKAVEFIPDLVITDLMMPKMDGVELCKKLKTDERTSHIPVIMLTAKASIEDRIEGLETGADAYVTKPFNIKELRVRVKNLIEQRKKLRERFSKDIKLEPKDIAITSADESFLIRAMDIIENHMEDSEFEVRDFQDEIGMSRMQLFRKIKALTDNTPSEFIRNLRLKRAAQLMEQNYGNVAQITYKVGFNNLSYFAKCFKELFEMSPSEYLRKHSQ